MPLTCHYGPPYLPCLFEYFVIFVSLLFFSELCTLFFQLIFLFFVSSVVCWLLGTKANTFLGCMRIYMSPSPNPTSVRPLSPGSCHLPHNSRPRLGKCPHGLYLPLGLSQGETFVSWPPVQNLFLALVIH